MAKGFADALAGWLVQQYGTRLSGVASSQTLVVEGLSDIDGMIQIQKLLQGMASVTKVAIGKLEGDKVTFNLSLQGDKAELVRGCNLRAACIRWRTTRAACAINGRSPDPGKDPDRPAWSGRFSICPAGDTLARKYHSQSPTSEATGPTVFSRTTTG